MTIKSLLHVILFLHQTLNNEQLSRPSSILLFSITQRVLNDHTHLNIHLTGNITEEIKKRGLHVKQNIYESELLLFSTLNCAKCCFLMGFHTKTTS